jgi:diketogulonate reductase-like aldo/keto reductase
LQLEYLDAFFLYGTYPLVSDTMAAWKVLESYVPNKIRYLGLAGVALVQLQAIYEASTIRPFFVQNWFIQERLYNFDVRAFCKDHGIVYQAVSILREDSVLIDSDVVRLAAKAVATDKNIALYLLVLSLGDVQIVHRQLARDSVSAVVDTVAQFANEGSRVWREVQPFVPLFKRLLWKLACEYEGTKSA